MKTLHLSIARIGSNVFDGEVTRVTLPGSEGELTLLPGHEPLIATLKAGTVSLLTSDGRIESHEIESGGILETTGSQATIIL